MDTGESLTFREYEEHANQAAHLLRELGVESGKQIALLFPNNLTYLVCKGAGERTGLRYVCINAHLKTDEVAYIVNDSEAQVVIVDESLMGLGETLPEACPNVTHWLVAGGPARGSYTSYDDAVAALPTTPIDDEQIGTAMLYSSGTTGFPKGIMRGMHQGPPGQSLPVYEFTNLIFRLDADMTYLSTAPLYHSAPHSALLGAMRLGATSIVMRKFDPERFLQLIEQYQVTTTQVVPTMMSRVMRLPAETLGKYDVSSLRAMVHGAAPCPPQLKREVIERFGPIVYEYYGATEGHGFCRSDSYEWLQRPGTVGKAVLGEIVILDEEGNECPTGVPGTIWFRGATNFEYKGAPEKTASAQTADGSMSTVDDIGYLDSDGYLYLTDRKSHMIISGGVNIYPQEIEDRLLDHPAVQDCAVIGVPDDDFGEQVKAVVIRMPSPAPEAVSDEQLERELIDYCAEALASYKCPKSIDFVDELPRTPTGKLQKKLLRTGYWSR